MFMYGAWRDIWKGKRRRGSEFKQVSELQGCKVSSFEFQVLSLKFRVSSQKPRAAANENSRARRPSTAASQNRACRGPRASGQPARTPALREVKFQSCKVSSVKAKAAGRGVRATRDDSQVSVSRTDANLE